jgi:DNA repair exonuclease SbcCD ATPase subunit
MALPFLTDASQIFSLPTLENSSSESSSSSLSSSSSSYGKSPSNKKPRGGNSNGGSSTKKPYEKAPNNDWKAQFKDASARVELMERQQQEMLKREMELQHKIKQMEEEYDKRVRQLKEDHKAEVQDLKKEVKEYQQKYEGKSKEMQDLIMAQLTKQSTKLDEKDSTLVQQFQSNIQQSHANKEEWRTMAKTALAKQQKMATSIIQAVTQLQQQKTHFMTYKELSERGLQYKLETEKKEKKVISNFELGRALQAKCKSEYDQMTARKELLIQEIPRLENELNSLKPVADTGLVEEPEDQELQKQKKQVVLKITELKAEQQHLEKQQQEFFSQARTDLVRYLGPPSSSSSSSSSS